MPFGPCNGPATFQRMMDSEFSDLSYVEVFVDDINIHSDNWKEHVVHLRVVFARLLRMGLKLKLIKCKFGKLIVIFLGHEASGAGVRPDPRKVTAIQKAREPADVSQLRSFLGLASYYRRFIRGFASISVPLNGLLKKGVTWEWQEEHQKAFETLRACLTSDSIIRQPDYARTFTLYTDASMLGLGGVLSQHDDDKQEYVIAFISRVLQAPEKNYSPTELECLAIVWAVREFRHYLLGVRFVIVTDHHSLKWLMETKDPSGRLARWSLKLQEYDFQIQHRKGRLHSNADALSRPPIVHVNHVPAAVASAAVEERREEKKAQEPTNNATNNSRVSNEVATAVASAETNNDYAELRRFAAAQRQDEELKPIIAYLEENVLPRDPLVAAKLLREGRMYVLGPHGQLLRLNPVGNKRQQDEVLRQLVVPRQLRRELLWRHHNDALTGGHLSRDPTYFRMRQRYYWDGMLVAIDHWCRACEECARQKTPKRRVPHPMLSMPVTSTPFEFVGVDVLGPLPRSTHGNRFIVVFSDYCTRWPEAFAIRNQKATTIADSLLEVVTRYGTPKVLLSDQGANFLSELAQAVYELLNVEKRQTTAYHPQTNGLTERFNSTVATQLSMYVNKNHTDWDRHLNLVLFAYRSTVQASVGCSPFRLLFGHEARLPLDAMLVDETTMYSSPFAYVRELQQRMQDVRAIARQNLETIAEARAADAASLKKTIEFRPGDRVWMWQPPAATTEVLARKLQQRWTGPYAVVEKLSAVTYRVRREVAAGQQD